MYSRHALILLLTISTLSGASWSETTTGNLLSTYRATIGIKINVFDFDVYNKDSTNPNGTLSEDFSYSPIFKLGSPLNYIEDSNWGGLMEYSFSGFTLNQQFVNNRLVDLGTSVKGYYAFVTPTLFYSFAESFTDKDTDLSLITGLGLGIGYLKATGDIIFTETTQQRLEIDVNGLALAISLFVDYRFENFMTRLSGELISHSKGNNDYDAFGFTWDFSYVFGL